MTERREPRTAAEHYLAERMVDAEYARSYLATWWELPISELDLSVKVDNVLQGHDIRTIGQLLEKTDDELLQLRMFGRGALSEVDGRLKARGLLRQRERELYAGRGEEFAEIMATRLALPKLEPAVGAPDLEAAVQAAVRVLRATAQSWRYAMFVDQAELYERHAQVLEDMLPPTPEELAAIRQGQAQIEAGEGMAPDEVRARLNRP